MLLCLFGVCSGFFLGVLCDLGGRGVVLCCVGGFLLLCGFGLVFCALLVGLVLLVRGFWFGGWWWGRVCLYVLTWGVLGFLCWSWVWLAFCGCLLSVGVVGMFVLYGWVGGEWWVSCSCVCWLGVVFLVVCGWLWLVGCWCGLFLFCVERLYLFLFLVDGGSYGLWIFGFWLLVCRFSCCGAAGLCVALWFGRCLVVGCCRVLWRLVGGFRFLVCRLCFSCCHLVGGLCLLLWMLLVFFGAVALWCIWVVSRGGFGVVCLRGVWVYCFLCVLTCFL